VLDYTLAEHRSIRVRDEHLVSGGRPVDAGENRERFRCSPFGSLVHRRASSGSGGTRPAMERHHSCTGARRAFRRGGATPHPMCPKAHPPEALVPPGDSRRRGSKGTPGRVAEFTEETTLRGRGWQRAGVSRLQGAAGDGPDQSA
jgi:hypothetical protein